MEGTYYKEHSNVLGRDMEYKVFGEHGKICLAFPPMGGRFWDFENFGMVETVAPWIESGKLQMVLVDGIDNESWCATGVDEHSRIEKQEKWFSYVTDELLPTLEGRNGDFDKAMTTGCSMGGLHATNFFLRRPDLFDTVISLSGVYNADFFFPGYTDPLVYDNSPVDFLPNMPEDHAWMSLYRDSDIILCVGQGAWEDDLLASTHRLDDILQAKGIPAWVDYWGTDVAHDWVWWKKQLPYFMENLLGDPDAPQSLVEKKAKTTKKASAPKAAAKKAEPAKPAAKAAPAVKKAAAPKVAAKKAAPVKAAAKPAAAKPAPVAKPVAAAKPASPAKPAPAKKAAPAKAPAAKKVAAAKPAPVAKPAPAKAATTAKPAAKKAAPAVKKPAASKKKTK